MACSGHHPQQTDTSLHPDSGGSCAPERRGRVPEAQTSWLRVFIPSTAYDSHKDTTRPGPGGRTPAQKGGPGWGQALSCEDAAGAPHSPRDFCTSCRATRWNCSRSSRHILDASTFAPLSSLGSANILTTDSRIFSTLCTGLHRSALLS